MGRITVLLLVAGVALPFAGCGAGNAPKREVLRSANPLTADLYLRINGPTGAVNYISGRLSTGAFAKYGSGAFLPPRIRRHRQQKVCSITHTISKGDTPSLDAWRGKKVRIAVYGGGDSSAIFCQIIPLLLARGS
jgi:hypothetical protein